VVRTRRQGDRLRLLRNPVTQFLLIGLVTIAAIVIGVSYIARNAASDESVAEARRINKLLAHQVVEPLLPPRISVASAGAADRFDRALGDRLEDLVQVQGVDRFAIRNADGTLLYASSEGGEQLGATFPLDADQERVLRDGGTGSQSSDPSRPENRGSSTPRVEIYTRIKSPEGDPLLFDTYYSLNRLERRQGELFRTFRWITLGPLLLLILLATLILSALTRQLTRASRERERLLRSAMDASDAERRRIARDLHDSVVQDLAGTAFSVSAVARTPDLADDSRETLDTAGASLRTSLKSLRSLLAEIHPPELSAEGLPAALADLIAPAGGLGIQASVSVSGAETASDDHVALVWRVAQEAVRNATRHSHASTLAVTVRGDGRLLTLEVVDDGIGFDPARTDPDSYGLRGLRSLVADNGGVLEVRSSPGEGTTVRMEVDAQ
jgi:signal transduction histidine kinase